MTEVNLPKVFEWIGMRMGSVANFILYVHLVKIPDIPLLPHLFLSNSALKPFGQDRHRCQSGQVLVTVAQSGVTGQAE